MSTRHRHHHSSRSSRDRERHRRRELVDPTESRYLRYSKEAKGGQAKSDDPPQASSAVATLVPLSSPTSTAPSPAISAFGLQPITPPPTSLSTVAPTGSAAATISATALGNVSSNLPYAVFIQKPDGKEHFDLRDWPSNLLETNSGAFAYYSGLLVGYSVLRDFVVIQGGSFAAKQLAAKALTLGDPRSESLPQTSLRLLDAQFVSLLVVLFDNNSFGKTVGRPVFQYANRVHTDYTSVALKDYLYGNFVPPDLGQDAWWKYRAPSEIEINRYIGDNKWIIKMAYPNVRYEDISREQKKSAREAFKDKRKNYVESLRRIYRVVFFQRANAYLSSQGQKTFTPEAYEWQERFVVTDQSPVAVLEARIMAMLLELYLNHSLLVLTARFMSEGQTSPQTDWTEANRGIIDPDFAKLLKLLASKQPALLVTASS